jgi:hypothetical protein
MSAKDFLQGLDGEFGKGKELAVSGEQAVGNERMDVGMKIEVFAKGVEGENDGGMRLGFAECGAQIKRETLMGCSAEMLEERAVPLKIGAEHLRQSEDVVPVGDCGKDAADEELGAGLDVFLVAGRTEPARFTGKSEKSVEAAVVTADAGEAAFEGAAVEEFVDDLWNGGTQWPVTGLVVVRVTGEEGGKVAVGALPEGRSARIACPVDVHDPETKSNPNVPAPWDTRHQSRLRAGVPLMTHPESLRRRAVM